MTQADQYLLNVLKRYSFQRGDFTLASGAKSNYYIDCRKTLMFPRGVRAVGRSLLVRLETLPVHVDAIGGMAEGAIPMVTAVLAAASLNCIMVDGFWVRKTVKGHGASGRIAGNLLPGAAAVILEDVTTTGESALDAVQAAEDAGANVVQVLSLVDRLQGAASLFASAGYPFQALFTVKDFGIEI